LVNRFFALYQLKIPLFRVDLRPLTSPVQEVEIRSHALELPIGSSGRFYHNKRNFWNTEIQTVFFGLDLERFPDFSGLFAKVF
jgi:hypothetical protein